MGKGPAGNRSQAKGTARLRRSAVALDRRANLCVAGPMATAQGRLRVFAGNHRSAHSYCDHPAHAAKTGPSVTLFKRALKAKGHGSFQSAWRTLQGIEAMNMIRKGRARGVVKGD